MNEEQETGDKRQETVRVATHSGSFHADDVFAVATLRILLGDIEIVRTRDPEMLARADYVVDVGQTYDPSIRRFDHHQEGKAGERENGVPYASFGLVWKEYGEKVCGSNDITLFLDQRLVQVIDAVDNGVEIAVPTYKDIYPHSINTLMHAFLPTWKEDDSGDAYDRAFLKMVDAAEVYLRRVITIAGHNLEAQARVREAYESAPDKRVIELDNHYPWHEVLSAMPEPLFVIYPRVDGNWGVKAVRIDPQTLKNRKELPSAWAGKRDGDLVAVTGVSDAVFCHNDRFLAVARSAEGARTLAKQALEI